MKTFHSTHCQKSVFFENGKCLSCEHSLAFLPDENRMAALEQSVDGQQPYSDGVDRPYKFEFLRDTTKPNGDESRVMTRR